MDSPNPLLPKDPQPKDELDGLVRGALETRVSGQEPPERVWEQIKLSLETDGSPAPRFRVRWSPIVIQAVVVILLVVMAGINLQTQLITVDTGRISFSNAPTAAATVSVAVYSASPSMVLSPSDEFGALSLKAHYETNPVRQVEVVDEPRSTYKPAVEPWDAVAAPASLESWSPSPPALAPLRFLHDSRNES